ncbi:hypothetical protein DXG03_005852 [Asterophora parasitica]|uniref:Uncharacterized protein n=1 Tax=Asterophora parasitica TaxID=117018 RepID=A0A9P7KAS9_9AGAR|nr:hypothetical protein DXG03_005852 [Asterophora parasitica]
MTTRNTSARARAIFGELVRAPPVTLSAELGKYTLDLAVIKIDTQTLDADNCRGNAINIDPKYTNHQSMDRIPESALIPPMLDANKDLSALIVFKNGDTTGTTIGMANLSAFSTQGSCAADAFNRIGGIITGGCGANEKSGLTYSFITKTLHSTKRFENAHLNRVIA